MDWEQHWEQWKHSELQEERKARTHTHTHVIIVIVMRGGNVI